MHQLLSKPSNRSEGTRRALCGLGHASALTSSLRSCVLSSLPMVATGTCGVQPIKSPGYPSPGSVRTTSRALRLCDCVLHHSEWIFWAARQHTRNPAPLTHIQRKLSTFAKIHVLSAKSLKPLALKGQGRHRLTWRRLCLPCQASAIYEFDLSQDLWWHFDPEQSPTP